MAPATKPEAQHNVKNSVVSWHNSSSSQRRREHDATRGHARPSSQPGTIYFHSTRREVICLRQAQFSHFFCSKFEKLAPRARRGPLMPASAVRVVRGARSVGHVGASTTHVSHGEKLELTRTANMRIGHFSTDAPPSSRAGGHHRGAAAKNFIQSARRQINCLGLPGCARPPGWGRGRPAPTLNASSRGGAVGASQWEQRRQRRQRATPAV